MSVDILLASNPVSKIWGRGQYFGRRDKIPTFRFHNVVYRGVATGGYIGIHTPKSVTVLFTCGTLTHVLKLQ